MITIVALLVIEPEQDPLSVKNVRPLAQGRGQKRSFNDWRSDKEVSSKWTVDRSLREDRLR